jgi:tetratricopeptide (TPR) repeat protein
MMSKRRTAALTALAAVAACWPAAAWGPQTEQAAVEAAVDLLSATANVPLERHRDDVRRGARAEDATIEQYMSAVSANPVAAVANEMELLSAVRGARIAPYFSYRLGVIGQAVASLAAPMTEAPDAIRNEFYADVDRRMADRVPLQNKGRRIVDPRPYFERARRAAQRHDGLITVDYRQGQGYAGVARAFLAEAISNSTNAVADVWYTILRGMGDPAQVSADRKRDYFLDALDYYLGLGARFEAQNAYDRLMELGLASADLHSRIGDMFAEAGEMERAIEEYQKVLEMAPGRSDVREKVASYYIEQGDQAWERERLEQARAAYQQALDFDGANETAQGKLLDAEAAIAERAEKQRSSEEALALASDLRAQADQLADRGQYGQALDLLRDAIDAYQRVAPEFPGMETEAASGLEQARRRMREMRSQLLRSAQTLSGSGSMAALDELLSGPSAAARDGLQRLIEDRHEEALDELKSEVERRLDAEE